MKMANYTTGPRPRYNDGVTDPRELVITTAVWDAIPKADRKLLRKATIYWENVERRKLGTILDKLDEHIASLDGNTDEVSAEVLPVVKGARDILQTGGESYVASQEELNKDRGAKIREAAALRRANALSFGDEVNPLDYISASEENGDDDDDESFDPGEELDDEPDVPEVPTAKF
jgi:hypothetical protein